jgi:uncharacterized membrane protein YkvA (DUF1232 family)
LTQSAGALYLVYRDPRTPWYTRLLTACLLSYAGSPIHLIPSVIPILGYLNEWILVSLGLALTRWLIPPDVLAESRARAPLVIDRATNLDAAVLVVAVWMLLAVAALLSGLELLARIMG